MLVNSGMFSGWEGCVVVSVLGVLCGNINGESGRRFLATSLDGVFAFGILGGSLDAAGVKLLDGVLRRSLEGVRDLRFLRYFRFMSLSSERSGLGSGLISMTFWFVDCEICGSITFEDISGPTNFSVVKRFCS